MRSTKKIAKPTARAASCRNHAAVRTGLLPETHVSIPNAATEWTAAKAQNAVTMVKRGVLRRTRDANGTNGSTRIARTPVSGII